ncbi:MAG: D-glycero-beta-D-manno-heptose-7-phosphate kinase [Melioribacteraceae bacterium]|nr:D-glycero-beta-D-manno-heptose-7-phosphate kinase [Melioribacteraceae bacterium]
MKNLDKKKIFKLKSNLIGKKIAVIGDMMLDSYYWGRVNRISPEAPVPVLEVDNEFSRFGGAMNVAKNIQSLGGIPFPIGVIGNDSDAAIFHKLLRETNIDGHGLITDASRHTTTKTRVIAHKQHVIRIDKENTNPIDSKVERKIIKYLSSIMEQIDAVILEDYNKGVLTENLIKEVIKISLDAGKIISVDPKFNNFFEYKNVTVFKPNRKETEDALGMRIRTKQDLEYAGKKLLEELNPTYLLLTLGEDGIALFEKNNPVRRIPTKARKVSDVSGAGDTVIATITASLAAGYSIDEASYLANFAGGIVCEEVGIVPIDLNLLLKSVKEELA